MGSAEGEKNKNKEVKKGVVSVGANMRRAKRTASEQKGTGPIKGVYSLRVIADAILPLVSGVTGKAFHINALAEELCVPRRRLYDVLTLWDGLCLVRRLKKPGTYEWLGNTGFQSFLTRAATYPPRQAKAFLDNEEYAYSKRDSAQRRFIVVLIYLLLHPERHRLGTDWDRQSFHAINAEAAAYAQTNDVQRRAYDTLNMLLVLDIVTVVIPGPTNHRRYAWTPDKLKVKDVLAALPMPDVSPLPKKKRRKGYQEEEEEQEGKNSDNDFDLDVPIDWSRLPTELRESSNCSTTGSGSDVDIVVAEDGSTSLPVLFHIDMPPTAPVNDFFH